MLFRVFYFLILMGWLSGCPQPVGVELSRTDQVLWVAKDVVAGRQCEPFSGPPDLRKTLEAQGVKVYKEVIIQQPVCMACGVCPAYAATYYELIDAAGWSQAQKLGFRREVPPRAYQ